LAGSTLVRVAALTLPIGNALAEDIHDFMEAGVDAVITKPVAVKALRDTLERLGALDETRA
jgi:CheY-like chemotaxis protein